MTLEELRADIEARLPVHPECGNYYQTATGEPYIEVVIGGEKAEGQQSHAWATSEQSAVRLLHEALVRYVDGKTGTLYWRIPPETDCMQFRSLDDEHFKSWGPSSLWLGYARLLVSDKPQIQPQALPVERAA
jgi:hypothetical protein